MYICTVHTCFVDQLDLRKPWVCKQGYLPILSRAILATTYTLITRDSHSVEQYQCITARKSPVRYAWTSQAYNTISTCQPLIYIMPREPSNLKEIVIYSLPQIANRPVLEYINTRYILGIFRELNAVVTAHQQLKPPTKTQAMDLK